MDFAAHVEEQFAWLLTMAKTPGWEHQAWHRAKELEALDPMYAGFKDRIKAEMGWSKSSSPSEPAEDRTTGSTGPSGAGG